MITDTEEFVSEYILSAPKKEEVREEKVYEPTYITSGMPVRMEVEKGAWFKIGVNMQNSSEENKDVYVEVENVEKITIDEIKEIRSKRLLELSDNNEIRFLDSYIGKTVEVLFEECDEQGYYKGHTANYIMVKITS